MCYSIKGKLETALKRARYDHDEEAIKKIMEELKPYYEESDIHFSSGFAHPKLLMYTSQDPTRPKAAQWGLVPHWVKNEEQQKKIWTGTLNARSETVFEKPSFRDSIKTKRCLIPIDGFYEYHHYKGGKYPFYVYRKDQEPMNIAGLWSEWVNREIGELLTTCTMVTTEANELLAKIHNNPKLKGPRIPIILPKRNENIWLSETKDALDRKLLEEIMVTIPSEELAAHTVRKLTGKGALGNVAEVSDEFTYEDLEF